MPEIILKETTAHLASYYKHVTSTALSTNKNTFFIQHLSLATFVPGILQSF